MWQQAGILTLKPIPLKLAIPYLEAAALEDDDSLQDKWAALLVNAANPAKSVDLSRSYIAILEEITPFEAALLDKIYGFPFDSIQHNGIWTAELPDRAIAGNEKEEEPAQVKDKNPSELVVLGLANLKRLGCIQTASTWGGGENFKRILPTVLGKHFVAACTM
nr:Abi-alpha family protein [Cupriavidus sp. IK-TO18]